MSLLVAWIMRHHGGICNKHLRQRFLIRFWDTAGHSLWEFLAEHAGRSTWWAVVPFTWHGPDKCWQWRRSAAAYVKLPGHPSQWVEPGTNGGSSLRQAEVSPRVLGLSPKKRTRFWAVYYKRALGIESKVKSHLKRGRALSHQGGLNAGLMLVVNRLPPFGLDQMMGGEVNFVWRN